MQSRAQVFDLRSQTSVSCLGFIVTPNLCFNFQESLIGGYKQQFYSHQVPQLGISSKHIFIFCCIPYKFIRVNFQKNLYIQTLSKSPSLSFEITCFFCKHFEELQTVLLKVELILNNPPLTCVYPNTIDIYMFNTQSFAIWRTVIIFS